LTSITVGTHPKGVVAGPEGAQVGLYDSAELALVVENKPNAFVSTNGRGANAVAYWQGLSYMVHRDSNTVSIIDLTARRQIGVFAVGALPWGADAAAGRLYVASFADNVVNVFDLANRTAIATVSVMAQPALVAAANDRAFISHLNGYISVVGADGTLLDTFTLVGGDDAFGIAIDPDLNRLFVGSRKAKTIYVLDSQTGTKLTSYPLSVQPYALAFNSATKQLLVVDAVNNRLLAIDTRTGEQLGAHSLAPQGIDHGGQGLAVGDNTIYVTAYAAGILDIFDGGECIDPAPARTPTPTPRPTSTATPGPTATPTPANWQTLDNGEDTYINGLNPGMNYSDDSQLLLRTPGQAYALLNFDLSALPAGRPVQNAQLRIRVLDETLPANIVVKGFPLLRDWNAGIVNWTKAASGAPWTAPGASGPEDRNAAFASVWLAPDSYMSLDVTETVQDWLANPDSQHGVLLAARSEAAVTVHLASFDHNVTAWRPRLEITLAP